MGLMPNTCSTSRVTPPLRRSSSSRQSRTSVSTPSANTRSIPLRHPERKPVPVGAGVTRASTRTSFVVCYGLFLQALNPQTAACV